MSRNSICKKVMNNDGNIEFQFNDEADNPVVDVSQFNDEIVKKLAMHGASQKFGDSYAGVKNVDEARAEFQKVMDNLTNGIWATRKEGGGAPRSTMLFDAVVNVMTAQGKKVTDAVKEAVQAKLSTAEGRKTVKSNALVSAEYERLRIERQQAKLESIDTSEASIDDLI